MTVGTVFERSHITLDKWLLAAFLICASKKGISAHQVLRMLGISYKSAWFMMHRLREAMRPAKYPGPLGGLEETVEVDETYVGGKATNRKSRIWIRSYCPLGSSRGRNMRIDIICGLCEPFYAHLLSMMALHPR